jgi:periplasmic copper chaperone A
MMRRLLLLILLLVPGTTSYAATVLHVRDAWVQQAPPGAAVLAAYLVLANGGTAAQTLVSVSSPDFAAVEIHTSQIVNGIASMTHLKDLTIPAQGQQIFAPGSAHLMLLRPKRALRAGDPVRLRLHFSGAVTLDVTAKVTPTAPGTDHHH